MPPRTEPSHVIINRHGLKMALYVDSGPHLHGVVFILHGFTSAANRPVQMLLAQTAAKNGFNSVRIDTTHACGQSDGSPEKATITTFLSDLEDTIAWFETTYPDMKAPYILVGSSLGGISVLEYAYRHPGKVSALAPIATVISGVFSIEADDRLDPDIIRQWRTNGFSQKTCSCSPDGLINVPWSHMEDRLKYDALAYAKELTIPVLMFVGDQDIRCPPDQQKNLFEALGSTKKEIHILEGAPHTLKEAAHLRQLGNTFETWLLSLA